MMMVGRKYSSGNGYRYGFNGQEKSNEVDPNGNSMFAEFWQYDARLGRRWNVDPIVKSYESPYAAFGNNPIWNIDPLGSDTAKYLSNAQVFDAIKIGFNVINNDIKNKQYKIGADRSKQLDDAMTAYFNNHQDMTFGQIAEFREIVGNYHRGLQEVASSTTAAWSSLAGRINNTNLSAQTQILQVNATIERYNGFLLNVITQGANLSVGLAAGAVGVKAGVGPRGPAIVTQVPSKGKDIALGVNETLPNFAKSVGGETWKTWGAQNFPTRFTDVINKPTNRIHFNLTGPDGNQINVWNAVNEGAKGFTSSRATSWELYQLYNNPAAQARTTFYHNGTPVTNPFK